MFLMRMAGNAIEAAGDGLDSRGTGTERRRNILGCLAGTAGAMLVFWIESLAPGGLLRSGTFSPLLFMVVVGTAWYGGWAPALCTALTGLCGLAFILASRDGVALPELREQVEIGAFLAASLLVALLAARLHEGRRRIELQNRQLRIEAARGRRLLQAMRESEERMRLATEGGGMGTWDFHFDVRRAFWSDHLFELYGVRRTPNREVPWDLPLAIVHPEDRARVRATLDDALCGEAISRMEYRIVRPSDGQVRWMAASGRFYPGPEGSSPGGAPQRLAGVVFDITERKLAAEQLSRIEWMLDQPASGPPEPQPYGDPAQFNARRVLLDAVGTDVLQNVVRDYLDLLQTSVSVYERNGDYALRSFSHGWCRFMDATSRQAAGADHRTAVQSGRWHCHESCWQAARQSMETGSPVDIACRGGIRIYAVPIRAGSVPVGSLTFGYGDPPADPGTLERLAGEYAVSVDELAARARAYASRPPFVITQAMGRLRSSARLVGEIVQRRRLEHELNQRLTQLAEADRRKDEFLATLAHELRNPLAPIRNALQILKRIDSDSRRVVATRDIIDRQVTHMVRLIDDLLDVSRISRNRLELRCERIELAAAVRQAVEASRPVIEAAHHRLRVELPAEPVWLEADLVRLSQVFLNLLNNGAKYMDPGGQLSLIARRDGDRVAVHVRDAGVGIPPGSLPHIFDAFFQGPESAGRAPGGLGIGLMLARRVVEMHGGSIRAQSEGEGRGTEIIVQLPVAEGPADADEPRTPAALTPVRADVVPLPGVAVPMGGRRRVLVVDDNRDSADSLATILQLAGSDTRIAHDGESALECARQMRPDIIVCDIGMPKLSGYDVARAIRGEEWGREVLLIALTGWGQEVDRLRSEEAGFDHHLVKPVDPAMLLALIGRRLQPTGS